MLRPLHDGAVQKLLPDLDQWLQSASVLYRPDIIRHWMVLMLTLYGEGPAVVRMWCEVVRVKKLERIKW